MANKPLLDSIQKTRVDRPEVAETFADSVGVSLFDGQTFRIELLVTRLDPPKQQKPPTGKQYPACRLVLTPHGGLALYNQLHNFISAMEQQGIITREEIKKGTIQ